MFRDAAGEPVAQVFQHELDGVARWSEDDGRYAPLDEIGCEHDRALQVAGADAELGVDHGRIEHEDAPAAAPRAGLIEERDLVGRFSDEARGVLARVADGRRGREERGVRSVKARDADEPRDDVGHVRAENAAIGVELVEHHELEPLKKARPLRVMREDRHAQHVGVGHHDRARVARRSPRIARRVAVVDDARGAEHRSRQELAEARLLIAREGLGRKYVEGARVFLSRERFEHRQMKAETFAAGRRRGHDEVPPRESELERVGLVAVELADATLGEGPPHALAERSGQGNRGALGRLERAVGHEARPHVTRREPPGDRRVDAGLHLPGGRGHRDPYTKQMFRIAPGRKSLGFWAKWC